MPNNHSTQTHSSAKLHSGGRKTVYMATPSFRRQPRFDCVRLVNSRSTGNQTYEHVRLLKFVSFRLQNQATNSTLCVCRPLVQQQRHDFQQLGMVQSVAIDFFAPVKLVDLVVVCSLEELWRHEQIQFFLINDTIFGLINHLCYSNIVMSSRIDEECELKDEESTQVTESTCDV
jgi:hypothetical protein